MEPVEDLTHLEIPQEPVVAVAPEPEPEEFEVAALPPEPQPLENVAKKPQAAAPVEMLGDSHFVLSERLGTVALVVVEE